MRRLCCWLLLLACYSNNTIADVTQLSSDNLSKRYSGLLGNQDSYTFNLNPNESMIVEVTQPNADLKLRVSQVNQDKTDELLFEASVPATTWLSEKIIINDNQCQSCKVQVLSINQYNLSGNYTLTAERIKRDNRTEHAQLMSLMTSASIQWFDESNHNKTHQSSLNNYQQAAELAKAINDTNSFLLALYYQSQLSHLAGNYDIQESLLSEITSHDLTKHSEIHSRALFDLGHLALNNAGLSFAQKHFEQAFLLATDDADILMQASILSAFAYIKSELGLYDEAFILFEQANHHYVAEGDWQNSIESLIRLGWYYYRQGNTESALNFYQQALSYATKSNSSIHKKDIFTKIGSIYRRIGDLEQAHYFIDQSLTHTDALGSPLLDGWAKQAKARIFMDTGMFDLADDWLQKALISFEKAPSTPDIFNVYYFLGINQESLGNYQAAEEYYRKVLTYDKKIGNSYDISSSYFRLASNGVAQQKFKAAKHYQRQALEHFEGSDNGILLGNMLSQAGLIYFNTQEFEKAKQHFEQALSLQFKNNDITGLITTHYRVAIMQNQLGDIASALRAIEKANDNIHTLQQKLAREDHKANFLALQQKVSSLHIHIKHQQGTLASETLKLAEHMRSQVLNNKLLQIQNNRKISPKNKDLRDKLIQQLQSQVIDYNQLSSPSTRRKVAQETRKISEQLSQLNAKIDEQRTNQNKNKNKKIVNTVELAQLQKNLPEKSLILYFDTDNSNSHIWAITKQAIKYYDIANEDEFSPLISQLISQTKQASIKQSIAAKQHYQSLINQLSVILLENVSNEIVNADDIIVIPDGSLHYLPFSLLVQPNSTKLLVESKTLSYAPSLEILNKLTRLNKARLKGNNKILVMANPAMQQNRAQGISDNLAINRQGLGFNASELPYSELEARYINELSINKVTELSKSEANKAAFYQESLSSYQIIHFATHGIANSYQPALGGLVFSNTSSNDNLLLAPEINQLNLNSDLVVLSACETALGKMINGEGIFSLSRAFFSAGSKRVLASLWSVQDDATAKLMKEFYQRLLIEKLPAQKALQQAKLAIKNYRRKNGQRPWSAPYYWAGFVLQGPGGKFID